MADMTTLEGRTVLYTRVGEFVALADVGEAMATAGRQCGLALASRRRPTDDELAALDAADHDKFLDVAELRVWQSILANATDAGLRDAALDESPRDVRDLAREKIKALTGKVKEEYGVGTATLHVGVIGLDFAAGDDDDLDEF